jgi:predicted enzyme related to lactoylglutathione lyase
MRSVLTIVLVGGLLMLAVPFGVSPTDAATKVNVESGRFVWHDLMTKDVAAARRFYGGLLGWKFEETTRGARPYVLAKVGSTPVAGFVDVTEFPNAGTQWLSYMAVSDVDQAAALVQSAGGKVIVTAREVEPVARVAVIADPQGAPLGVARLRKDRPDPITPIPMHFFWDELLARDAPQALDFYKRLAGYDSRVTDTRLGVEYHVLRRSRGRAGLFQLPANSEVQPLWLPYVLVGDPAMFAARVASLGGRVILPAAPERRNNSLVVIADPGGAPLALQKYPF